jgi:glutamate 5-kinase
MDKKRIVLKVGSAVLTQDGKIAHRRLDNLVEFISILKDNYEVILVSSGAVAAGYTLLPLDKSIVENKQALASIGQPLLMSIYKQEFKKYDIISSQVLLEATIFHNDEKLSHAKGAIETLLKNNIVPIINENDVTVIDELVFGDNDQLAAYVTHYFEASLLVILTDIDGYYSKNPHQYKDAILLKEVNNISKEALEATHSTNTIFATGGIVTKLKAADFLIKNNKQMFLTSGFELTFAKEYLINHKHLNGTLFKKD